MTDTPQLTGEALAFLIVRIWERMFLALGAVYPGVLIDHIQVIDDEEQGKLYVKFNPYVEAEFTYEIGVSHEFLMGIYKRKPIQTAMTAKESIERRLTLVVDELVPSVVRAIKNQMKIHGHHDKYRLKRILNV